MSNQVKWGATAWAPTETLFACRPRIGSGVGQELESGRSTGPARLTPRASRGRTGADLGPCPTRGSHEGPRGKPNSVSP